MSRWLLGFAASLVCSSSHFANAEPGRDCYDLYFGYEGSPNFEAAYTCFEAKLGEEGTVAARDPLGVYSPMVLMRLNGRGVEVDLNEASRLLSLWQEVEPSASEQRLFLQRVVLERKSGLGATDPAPIEFCALPADAMFEARCDEIRRRQRDGERASRLRNLREQMPEAVRPKLGGLIFAYGGYADQEMVRITRAHDSERDSTQAVGEQRKRVQSHFDEAVRRILVERAMPVASRADASRKERELADAFETDRSERRVSFEAYEKALPDSAPSYARQRRKYDDAARQSQAAWRRYRDVWVEIARLAAGASAKADASEASVRILLAEQRMTELRPE